MEWSNKLEWLHGANKSGGLAIVFKDNLNYDLIKTKQDYYGNQIGVTRNSELHESLNLIDAYRELHSNVKKFKRFQLNSLIACKLDFFSLSKIFFQVKICYVVSNVKSDHKLVTLLLHHNSSNEEKDNGNLI